MFLKIASGTTHRTDDIYSMYTTPYPLSLRMNPTTHLINH